MLKLKKEQLKAKITGIEKPSLNLPWEKSSSSWLNVLLLNFHKFNLNKSEFRDGIALRYGWEPKNMPMACASDENFTISYSVQCPKKGYIIIRHNEIRDILGKLLDDVYYNSVIEPNLQPIH